MINENNEITGIYIRVSTMNQIDRDSLKTQEERLIAYCVANEIKQYKIYRDPGYSAKDIHRPGLELLMKDIREGVIKNVYVVKLDRITRSIADLLRLTEFFNKYGVSFVSISDNIDTSTAMGRAMQNLLGVFAQLEREVTAERVATDMRHRANKGKWNGGVIPYGYTTQSLLKQKYEESGIDISKALEICPELKKLFIDPDESEIVKWVYETYIKTNSIRNTTIKLNEIGVKTRKGELWAKTTIHRILTNPTYTGMIWYGKRKTDPISGKLIAQDKKDWLVGKGEHDPIIYEGTFNIVQKLISNRRGKPTRAKRTYLLSGIIRCGHCGGAMTGHTFNKKGTDKSYSYYKCYNKLQKGPIACKGLSLTANQLEEFVIDQLIHLSENRTFLSDKKKMLKILKRC
jgi:site-specific DNA recombinase